MPVAQDNTRGILAMNAAMFGFICNDTLMKATTAVLPLGEILFARSLIATVIVAVVVAWTGVWRDARRLVDPLMAMRLVGEIGATVTYVTALVHMPIGNVSAVFQTTPLAITAGAAIFLAEPVGWRRWSAIAVGFAGVLLIVRPGADGFNSYALLVLGSVACVVLRDLATARLPRDLPTSLVSLATSVVVAATGLAIAPFETLFSPIDTWRSPELWSLAALTGAACFLLIGYVMLIVAMRLGDMSAIAPFRYVLLVWSFIFGFLFFGDRPDGPTLVGAAIVVASGLYTLHRERIRLKERATAAA